MMPDTARESAAHTEGGPRFFQRIEDIYKFYGLKRKVDLDTEEGKKALLQKIQELHPQNVNVKMALDDVLRNYRQLKAEQEFNKNTSERVPESTWEKIKETLKKHKVLLTFLGLAAIAGGLYWWNPVLTIGGAALPLRTLVTTKTIELWQKVGGPDAWKKIGGPEKWEWLKQKALEVKTAFNDQLKKLGIGKDAAPRTAAEAAAGKAADKAASGADQLGDAAATAEKVDKAVDVAQKIGGQSSESSLLDSVNNASGAAGAAAGSTLQQAKKIKEAAETILPQTKKNPFKKDPYKED